MKTSISSIALAVIGVASLAFAIPMSVARAQQAGPTGIAKDPVGQDARPDAPAQRFGTGQAQPGFPPQNGFTVPGQPFPGGQGPQMRGGMMGGPSTMVADGESLFILQGNMLFKVNKGDLRVTRVGSLPMGPPMQPGPFEGNPGAPTAPDAVGPRRNAGGATGAPPTAGTRGGGQVKK